MGSDLKKKKRIIEGDSQGERTKFDRFVDLNYIFRSTNLLQLCCKIVYLYFSSFQAGIGYAVSNFK